MIDFVLLYGFTTGLRFLLRPLVIIPLIGITDAFYFRSVADSFWLIVNFVVISGIVVQIFERYFIPVRIKFLQPKLSIYLENFPKESNKKDRWIYFSSYFPSFLLLFLLSYIGLLFIEKQMNHIFIFSFIFSFVAIFCMSLRTFIRVPQFNINGTRVPREKYKKIHELVKNGDVELVKIFLEQGGDINQLTNKKMAPIHISITSHNREMTRFLIKANANLELPGGDFLSKPPIIFAIIENDIKVIKWLLESGASPHVLDSAGNNTLWYSMYNALKNLDIFELLLSSGVNVNHKNANNTSLLLVAAGLKTVSFTHHRLALHFVNRLIALGLSANGHSGDRDFPIIAATNALNFEVVTLLIQHKANIDSQNVYQSTPLLEAIESHNLKMVQLLIKNGANVNLKGSLINLNSVFTPLILARKVVNRLYEREDKNEASSIINLLVSKGAK